MSQIDVDLDGSGAGGGITFDNTILVGDIAKRSGATTLGKTTAIPQGLIVPSQVLATFSHTAGIQELGSTLANLTLNWTYNRAPNPTSQSINQGIGAIANNLRTKTQNGINLNATTTFTISAVGDDGTNSSLQTTVNFQLKRYWGVSPNVLATDNDVKNNLSNEFDTARPVEKTFDASQGGGNNYLYFCYPKAWGQPSGFPIGTLFGGFAFSDYTLSTIVNFTNPSGHSEDYYLLKTNNTYNSAGLIWKIL